jgi:predicted alpha/beta hydrolase
MAGEVEASSGRGQGGWRGGADARNEVRIECRDGVVLRGHLWPRTGGDLPGTAGGDHGSVIINTATGVLARYYHPYARFLAANGFEVLTYDYRGIGLSRPASLRHSGYRWRDWGEQDFDAALCFMLDRRASAGGSKIDGTIFDSADGPPAGVSGTGGFKAPPMLVVGHSIGGFLPGLSAHANRIDRMLTMGAQYAYWRDYAPARRRKLFFKWHVAMPLLTAVFGYFPGRRLGWLEDLPAGVAHEWSFRRAHMEHNHPPSARQSVLDRFAAVTAPILALAMADDELGTLPAIRRTLAYYRNARITTVSLSPADFGFDQIGHFGLFHDRHADGFWRATLSWLQDGINPWTAKVV